MMRAVARPRLLVAVVVGFVLSVGQASAATSGDPVRLWSVSKTLHGTGEVPVASGAQVGGVLRQFSDVGRVVFNLPLHAPYWNLGNAGTVMTDISGSTYIAENLAIDSQGRIILVGRATSPTILDMALARYNPDGTLDATFANNGILTTDFHGKGDFGQDVAVDAAGRIVATGYTANGGNTEFALMRANP
jgi:uncharacterized delta-60 repeat protein